MISLWVRVLIMLVVYFVGLIMGALILGVISAKLIDDGDLVIYVRDGYSGNWRKILDDDPDEVID